MRNDEIQCEAEIRKNIVLIECGKALTLPLARLMCDCRFKEAWNKWNAEDIREEVKAKRKAYRETPEVKAKRKAYRETPEVKAKRKAYQQTPEVKAKRKAYRKTPEVKAKRKAYRETPEVKAKRKAYRETPEVKAKRKAYYEKNREKILDNKKIVRIVKLNRRSLRLRTSNSS